MTSLMCNGIVNAGFDHLPKDAADEFGRELDDPAKLTMPNYILAKLVESQPLASLKNIYGQLEHLMQWGYYFAFARSNEAHLQTIKAKTKIAIGYIRTADKNACSEMLQNVYRYMFHVLQEAFVSFGIAEAAHIKLPQDSRGLI